MSKAQKALLWIFGAMFLIPEILFFTTPLLLKSIYGVSFLNLSSLFINYSIFFSHPFYLLVIIAIEWVGVLGLTIISIKLGKKLILIIPIIILLWLSFLFCLVYITGVSMG